MAPSNLVRLQFQNQSLPRKTGLVQCSRSRTRTLPDGREIRRGAAYERRRQEVLRRDGSRCALCNSGYEVEVHHKTKRSILRDNPIDNLIAERSTGHQHNGGRQ